MDHAHDRRGRREPVSAFDSTTFDRDGEVKIEEDVGAASISPSGRDIVLASFVISNPEPPVLINEIDAMACW
jgi:hypothetical protein